MNSIENVDAPYRKQQRLKHYDYSSNGAYFITICTAQRNQNTMAQINAKGPDHGLFGGPSAAVALTDAGRIVKDLIERIDQVYPGVRVDTYCIMPDHIHMLLILQGKEDGPPKAAAPTAIPKIINSLKSLATKRCGLALWQRGYYDHIVRCEEELNEIREYIEQNPQKKLLLDTKTF